MIIFRFRLCFIYVIVIIYVIIKCCIFMAKIKCLKQTFIDNLFQIQVLINGRRGLQNMEFWQIGLLGTTWPIEDQDLVRKKLARVNNISSMQDCPAEEDGTAIEVQPCTLFWGKALMTGTMWARYTLQHMKLTKLVWQGVLNFFCQ